MKEAKCEPVTNTHIHDHLLSCLNKGTSKAIHVNFNSILAVMIIIIIIIIIINNNNN
jgi:hypothetical protein